ncbi:MAG: cellulose synthase/poly-beta-1,6-N-acetylglucosamine synthase-like glycosyltransferase [Candidatus Nanohaloarchaea archaeon]
MKKKIIRGLEVALTGLTFALLMFYGGWTGLELKEYSINLIFLVIDIAIADAISSTIFFTMIVSLTGLVMLKGALKKKDGWRSTYQGGKVNAVIPVYKDAEVMHQSVETLSKSNYDNLEITVIYEPDDESTERRTTELESEYDAVNAVESGNPGSKAKAVNYAIENSDADYYAVFDADEEVDPVFVPAAVSYIEEEDYDIFQGRRIPKPDGVLEAFCYCERALFHTTYSLTRYTGFKSPRSSSTVMKKSAWEEVGGYSDMLTEDLDFPHKCYRAGLKVKQAYNYTNRMEAPHSLKDFWGQRKRWNIGQVQIMDKALSGGFGNNKSIRGAISTFRSVFGLTIGALLLPLVAKFLILLLFGFELIYVPPLMALSLIPISLSLIDTREGKVQPILLRGLLSPLVIIVSGTLIIKSVFEYLFTWNGEWYQVEK